MAESKVVCVSVNPAMDRRVRLTSFEAGGVNRAESAEAFAGGKAAHVAMAARALGADVAWIGFLGGAIGKECAGQLDSLAIRVVPIPTAATTRVNLEIIERSGRVTEILEPGGHPTAREIDELVREFAKGIRDEWKGGVIVISGSVPSGVSFDFYFSLIEIARSAGVRVFLDTSGEALRSNSKGQVDFIKVNRSEAEDLLERSVGTIQEATSAAREISRQGPKSAAITLGQDGLVWQEHRDGPAWMARPPRMSAISTVGSGDATLAGFAYAAIQQITGERAVRLAAACGAANCTAPSPGRIDSAIVQSLLSQIEVREISS